jgi:diguanylate cyclase (GGDEF)-like protein/PAS domain S-box-containing protein
MRGPPASILIVDDEPRNRKLLEAMLRREGYETTAAANGEEALAAIVQRAPDLILLDIKLPGIDGYQVARALKGDPATSNIPIIMVTVLVDRDARMAAFNAGVEELVTKPIDPSELTLRVRNLLRMKAYGDLLESHSLMLEQKVQARTAELLDSEQRLRAIFETDPECVKVVNKDMVLLDMNPAGLAMLEATSLAEVQAQPLVDFIVPEHRAAFADLHARVMRGESDVLEFQVIGLKGGRLWLETHAAPLDGRNGKAAILLGITRDITARKAADARIIRLNRVYAVLSGINSAIVRIRGRDELFREMCRIAVSKGGFVLARVVEVDADGKARIATSTESDTRLFQGIVDDYNRDPEHSSSMLRLALLGRQPLYSNDVAGDSRIPNRAALTKGGNYALAVLPIHEGDRFVGSLILRAQSADAFDNEEKQLLLELTGNISFALAHIEQEERLGILSAGQRRDQEELRRFGAAMDATADAIYLVDRASMSFVHVNDAACRMRNQTRDELLALGPTGLLGATRPDLERTYDAIIASGVDAEPLEVLRTRHDGTRVWVELRRHALRLEERWTIVTLVRDITERKKSEERIRRLNRVYAVLSGINTLIVRVRDREELFKESCRVAVEAGGFSKAWIGIIDSSSGPFRIVAAHGGDPIFFQDLEKQLVRKITAGKGLVAQALATLQPVIANDAANNPEVLMKDNTGADEIRSIAVLPLVVAGGSVGVLTLVANAPEYFDDDEMKLLVELAGDIAFAIQNIKRQEELDYLAYYDALTGLANRRLFLERVAQHMRAAVSGGHKLALFFLDLERFRNINDSLGRPAGDTILKLVAEWLMRNVGDASLLARVGADHFAVVLPEVKPEGNIASLLDKASRALLNHPFKMNDTEIRIATKVGVALFPNDGTDADTLLKNAEAALKKAKASGERYLFFKQKMTDQVAGNLTMENQLREALEKEEFVLHYQPKVNLESGGLTGAEGLIRWNNPRTGLVPPGQFIPILEETGLIYDVGRWALRKAIEDYMRWRTAGLPAVRIAVNVSPLQLRNRGFVDEIRQKVGVDPAAAAGLELEITESLIMEDVKHNIGSLQAIRAMGVTIAIDDFGTGFSSLSYLSKLPVDTLKIDRSFVIDMTSGAPGLSLISTIINLAHALKLKVVAEGVETEEQSRLLRLLRCDEMQGFLFSKPVPAEVFEARFLAAPVPA